MTFFKGRGGTVKKSHCMSSAIICVFFAKMTASIAEKAQKCFVLI